MSSWVKSNASGDSEIHDSAYDIAIVVYVWQKCVKLA